MDMKSSVITKRKYRKTNETPLHYKTQSVDQLFAHQTK
jgi:hypothetical protein